MDDSLRRIDLSTTGLPTDVRLLLIAGSMFALASVSKPVEAALLAFGGVVLGVVSFGARHQVVRPPRGVAIGGYLAVSVPILALRTGLVRVPEISQTQLTAWLGLVAALGLVGSFAARQGEPGRWAIGIAVAAAVIAAIVAVVVVIEHKGAATGLDVYLTHRAAAEALRDGANPYTDAVRVPDGSPSASEGAVIEGYAYPPVALVLYAGAALAFGDSRWISAAAWLILLGFWAWSSRKSPLLIAVLLTAAAIVSTRLVMFAGWTEPLTVVLLVAAAMVWHRPWLAGVLLGLALGSKQYMVLIAPLLFLHREERQAVRAVVGTSVAVLTLVPFALWDFGAFWDALVARPLGLTYRSDAQSIPVVLDALGLGTGLPVVLTAIVYVGVTWFVGRRAFTVADFVTGAAAVIGAFFLTSLAFVNYWWLVSALFVSGAALHARIGSPAETPTRRQKRRVADRRSGVQL